MYESDKNLFLQCMAESQEDLATVERDLLAIEKDWEEIDEERIDRVFRIVHTLKGESGFFELVKIAELARQTENVVALIRSRTMAPTPDCVSALLRAIDRLNELIQESVNSNDADIGAIMAELAGLYAEDVTPGRKGSATAGIEPSRRSGPLRTLLAEDDFACRLLLQTFLSRYGECHIAANGREAVEAFRSASNQGQTYDLICMDIMMPEMDGREAVRQIRTIEQASGIQSNDGAKIIMTTTVQDIREVFLCFRELCDAYLLKPIDLGVLQGQMRSYQLI